MKILIFTRNLVGFGGIPYSLANLISGKSAVYDDNVIDFLILDIEKIDKSLLSAISTSGAKITFFKFNFKIIFYLIKNIKKYDVIVSTCFRSFVFAKILSFSGRNVYLWLRGAGLINTRFKKSIFKILNNNHVIVNSDYTAKSNNISCEYKVVHNGVCNEFLNLESSDFYKRFEIEKYEKVICYIGGWSKIKNHITLLKAYAEMSAVVKNTVLLLIGEFSELTDDAKKIVDTLKITRVIFAGKVENASRYLKYVDIYVHPCFSEGFGNAVVEAMFAGCPVLVANAGAFPEYVKTEFMFDCENHIELSVKLINILNNNKSYDQFNKKIDYFSSNEFYSRFVDSFN